MVLLALLSLVSLPRLAPPAGSVYKQVQVAARAGFVAGTFVSGNKVMFTASQDGGASWSGPQTVAEPGIVSAGRHRGPRIAITADAIVISLVAGKIGGGKDGDLIAFRSTDKGLTWRAVARINDVAGAAREGLHAMAAGPNGMVYAAWLDLRKPGTRLYGSLSTDSGLTWSSNIEIYRSPSGTICQCCHPSLAIDRKGTITVMWRNAVDGNRDLYIAASEDRGKSFSTAVKLGDNSWKLDACPMDGGAVTTDTTGKVVSAWRREETVFTARAGATEREIHQGKDPAIAISAKGTYLAWRDAQGLKVLTPALAEASMLDPDGQYPQLLSLPGGKILAAWEHNGSIRFEVLQ